MFHSDLLLVLALEAGAALTTGLVTTGAGAGAGVGALAGAACVAQVYARDKAKRVLVIFPSADVFREKIHAFMPICPLLLKMHQNHDPDRRI